MLYISSLGHIVINKGLLKILDIKLKMAQCFVIWKYAKKSKYVSDHLQPYSQEVKKG